ncbi:hypothetical protein L810_3686 [Burkholderia sp. AU4i]|nr:hypothetical protein L810_3686 [Burkholderia sp. AU4i]
MIRAFPAARAFHARPPVPLLRPSRQSGNTRFRSPGPACYHSFTFKLSIQLEAIGPAPLARSVA